MKCYKQHKESCAALNTTSPSQSPDGQISISESNDSLVDQRRWRYNLDTLRYQTLTREQLTAIGSCFSIRLNYNHLMRLILGSSPRIHQLLNERPSLRTLLKTLNDRSADEVEQQRIYSEARRHHPDFGEFINAVMKAVDGGKD